MPSQSQHALQAFLAEIPVAIAMLDTQMRYVYCSEAWLQQYHLPGEVLTGKSHYDVFPEIPEHWRELHRRTLQGEVLESEADPFLRGDGTTQYISWKMKPWYQDDETLGGIILQTQDVSDIIHKRAKSSLNETILRQMERVASIGYWEVDLSTNKIHWSSQTCIIHELPLGYSPDLSEGVNFYREGSSRERIAEAVNAAIEHATPWNLELEIVTAKNNLRWVCAIGEAIFENGKCIRLFGTFQDITQEVDRRKELQQQRKNAEVMLTERSNLLAKISHELRTPLNGIVGMLQSLNSEQDEVKRQRHIEVALRSSKMLTRIVNDVLDYSKINHEDMQFEYSHFSIHEFFDDVVSMFQPMAEQKRIAFRHRLIIEQAEPEEWVCFDPVRLNQIVSNLLSNAIKFTRQGSVSLSASMEKHGADRTLKLVIADTGIGMSQRDIQSLFTPFKQVGKNTNALYGGTGLGLSIVKQLVDKMGGTITVKSEEGEGTRFIVALNLAAGQATYEDTLISQPLHGDAASLRILIVDDVDINISVLEAMLAKFNITQIDSAANGLECIARCKENRYDMILMDINMPVLDGIEATRRLHEQQLVPEKTIIVAVTAMTNDETRAKAAEVGIDCMLNKPIDDHALSSIIYGYLQ